ncbi:MAG: hypothetical protein AAF957_28330 [Planctomycetota bacterium]
MRPHRLLRTGLVSGLLLAFASGCYSVSSSVMVPDDVEIEQTFGGSVRIDTIGSDRQAMIGSRLIPAEELEEAVREVVLRHELFDEVVEEGAADNVLVVEFESIEEPEVGLDADCTLRMRWRLMSGDGSRTLWEEVVTSDETVNSYQERSSEQRSKSVIEKAVRSNLRDGVERLSVSNRVPMRPATDG